MLPIKMVIPSQPRIGIWRRGIIQIMITRACDLACCHCTQGSNLAGKPVMMSVDQFEQACRSLSGYWGVIGVFGGNPTSHPHFDEICELMRAYFPLEQRGLWTNNLQGKGAYARITFWPPHSNLNVHLNSEAYEEFRRDWPEALPYVRGVDLDSVHSSPWVAIKDVIPDQKKRWNMISDCDINKHWSALVGVVRGQSRAYFCELAYAQAALHEHNPDWDGTGRPMPDTGLPVEPGWWRRPLADFEAQVRLHCQACGIPLRREGVPAVGGASLEYTGTHAWIAKAKRREQIPALIETSSITTITRPATEYLPGSTPGYRPR